MREMILDNMDLCCVILLQAATPFYKTRGQKLATPNSAHEKCHAMPKSLSSSSFSFSSSSSSSSYPYQELYFISNRKMSSG